LDATISLRTRSGRVLCLVLLLVTVRSAVFVFCEQAHFDSGLDAGALVDSPSVAGDVWFEAVRPGELYLAPAGAALAVAGTSAHGFSDCRAAALTGVRIPMGTPSPGLFGCGKTDEGRIVEIRVVESPAGMPPADSPTLTVSFTTYNR
jgi:hypothetical protein